MVDIIDVDIPLLIGLPDLHYLQAQISCDTASIWLKRYKAWVRGQYVNDRIVLPIVSGLHSSSAARDNAIHVTELEAKRYHHHFKHVSVDGMVRALQQAGRLVSSEDRKILKKTVDACHQCIRSSALPRRPVVAYPYPTTFNNRLAADIFTVNDVKFLRVICLGTHFSRIVPLSIFNAKKSESSANVFEIFYSFWLNYLGLCDMLVVDQGKNFVSEEFHYSCEA